MSFCFISPGSYTGGPMALHQAASAMRQMGRDASIMYVTDRELGAGEYAFAAEGGQVRMRRGLRQSRPDPRLSQFNVPSRQSVPIDTHFVLPEVWPDLASSLMHHGAPNICLWWLSVDNFPLNLLKQLTNQRLIRSCNNLCQSAYAADFVRANGARRVSMLSDYVDLTAVANPRPIDARTYDVAYLPSKARGAEPVLEALRPDYSLIALENMGREEIAAVLSDCKIFLDCGNHPGKDRVPREAALCGCIPLVRHEGAARYREDVPLPDELFLSTDAFFAPGAVNARIADVLRTSARFTADLAAYRRKIAGERAVFEQEIRDLAGIVELARIAS